MKEIFLFIKKRNWRKILQGAIITGISVVILIILYIVTVNYYGEKQKQEIINTLQEQQLPTNLDYLAKGDPFDKDDNVTPLFLAVMELTTIPEKWKEGIPFLTYKDEDDLELCKAINSPLSDRLKLFTERQKDFYVLLDKVCNYSNYRYISKNVDTADFQGIKILTTIRNTAAQQAVLSLYKQSIGDTSGALDTCGEILHLSAVLNKSHFPFAGVDMGRITFKIIEQILSRSHPNENELEQLNKKLLAEIKAINLQDMAKDGIAETTDRLQNIELTLVKNELFSEQFLASEQYITRREISLLLCENNVPSKKKMRFFIILSRIWRTICPGAYKIAFVRSIKETLNDYHDTFLPIYKQAQASKNILDKNDKSEKSPGARFILYIIGHKARMHVATTALSIESYRIKNGHWPDKIDEIKNEYMIDPFTGENLKYKCSESGCIIYSIGPNQEDNDAKNDRTKDKDDIIFHLFNPEKRNK